MTDGRYRRPAQSCATVLAVLAALSGPALAGPADNAHFTKTFKIFCARMMNDLSPLYDFAKQQRLRSERRTAQTLRDGVQTENFRKWGLPHEGRRYLLAVDKMPNRVSGSGYLNFCMLQSSRADVAGVAGQLKQAFSGQITETDALDKYGPGSRSFIVRGYADVGELLLVLRHRSGLPLSLTAIKMFP